MGAAAGAAVRAGKGHQPHLPGNILFGAVDRLFQGCPLQKPDIDGVVLPDVGVGRGLDGGQVFRGDLVVEVDGHHILPQVEAHIVAAVAGADDAADDVLAGMLLHMVKPPGPVDDAGDGFSHGQRPAAPVQDDAVLFPHVGHSGPAQRALVGRLAAPLGIKGGAVQHHHPPVLVLLTGQDGGGEFL